MSALGDLPPTADDRVPQQPMSDLECTRYFEGLVHGYGLASGRRLASVTCGNRWIVSDLDAKTDSPSISRCHLHTHAEIHAAFLGVTDGITLWGPSQGWGTYDGFDK